VLVENEVTRSPAVARVGQPYWLSLTLNVIKVNDFHASSY